ncbi:MAG: phosphoenolpyruvate--protein phosphotransferase [Actinomycetota bacterium]|nr:phosphoenolpyruvate--protein phosphotransferase [Actinomycetota bacterium]
MKLTGIAAAPGLAVGPVFVHTPQEHATTEERILESEVPGELALLEEAVSRLTERLIRDRERLQSEGRHEAVEILEAHAELAQDPELMEAVEEKIRSHKSAHAAVLEAGGELVETFRAMEDEYMSARAEDIEDVVRRLAAEILGREDAGLAGLREPSVILASTLTPSETAQLRKGLALGFVTATGSRTSHVSIMARSQGIPAIVGVGKALEENLTAKTVALDGDAGVALTDPDAKTLAEFEKRVEAQKREREELDRIAHVEARTRSGKRIEVLANLGTDAEADDALERGAEGVGLFRTEFLFMEREELPDEDEQYTHYARVVETFGERPVTIRTLDIGGDKPLPGIERAAEENPFLGWRGIRMSLETPTLMKPQLRAVLRTAAIGNVRVMFPMVADVRELRRAKEVLGECREELAAERVEFGTVAVGAMIEVPSAALCAETLASEVDFFSIGTNDLTQYTLAADRGNERLAPYLQDARHPAVLALTRLTCEAAHGEGIPVGVCGEAAGDTRIVPELVAAGITELSMVPQAVAKIKKLVGEL